MLLAKEGELTSCVNVRLVIITIPAAGLSFGIDCRHVITSLFKKLHHVGENFCYFHFVHHYLSALLPC